MFAKESAPEPMPATASLAFNSGVIELREACVIRAGAAAGPPPTYSAEFIPLGLARNKVSALSWRVVHACAKGAGQHTKRRVVTFLTALADLALAQEGVVPRQAGTAKAPLAGLWDPDGRWCSCRCVRDAIGSCPRRAERVGPKRGDS